MSRPKVPSKDYARQYKAIWSELAPVLERAFFHDQPILGETVAAFESDLARYHEVGHAVGVGSGTDAIALSLRALGIGANDEVITGAHTFTGVVNAICLAGARPILVDGEMATGLMDPRAIEPAISPRTRAILAVHLYGHPVDIDRVADIARRRDILFSTLR